MEITAYNDLYKLINHKEFMTQNLNEDKKSLTAALLSILKPYSVKAIKCS